MDIAQHKNEAYSRSRGKGYGNFFLVQMKFMRCFKKGVGEFNNSAQNIEQGRCYVCFLKRCFFLAFQCIPYGKLKIAYY